MLNC